MAKPARRRCKNDKCREWFHPAFANQWWCSPECGTKIALERRSKERGNLVPYRVELINRIGQEAVDEIELNHNRHRWTVEECKAIKAEYQQKLKDLRNSRSEAA